MIQYTKDQYAAAHYDLATKLDLTKQNDMVLTALRILAGRDDRFVVVPKEPTEAMIEAINDDDTPYRNRRNKMNDRGKIYEIIKMTNEDWRECVTDDQEIMGQFATQEEATELYDQLVSEWKYKSMLAASEETE